VALAVISRQATIPNKYGLHARPAMQFVETANKYSSKIQVSNGVLNVDAKSIMSVMRLAATKGTVLTVQADGADAEQAIAELLKLVADGFGEMEPETAADCDEA
jgi:phosphocarrier protein